MLSVIELKETLSKLFSEDANLLEVYATPDFSLEQDRPVFTILCKSDLDVAVFYYKLLKIYPDMTRFYATCNQQDSILQYTRLVWRKGVWYV